MAMPWFLGDFGSYETDSPYVDIAMFTREAQLAGKMFAHDIAIQQSNLPTSHFQ